MNPDIDPQEKKNEKLNEKEKKMTKYCSQKAGKSKDNNVLCCWNIKCRILKVSWNNFAGSPAGVCGICLHTLIIYCRNSLKKQSGRRVKDYRKLSEVKDYRKLAKGKTLNMWNPSRTFPLLEGKGPDFSKSFKYMGNLTYSVQKS